MAQSGTKPLDDFHQMHFDSIQALRGITALFILLEHIRFLNCGAFGVDIFFCISGFMILFSTHSDSRFFLRKRLIRILPLYYLMTLGTFLLLLLFPRMFEQTRANPVFLLKSFLFLPFDIGGGVLQPLMRIGWTVNCEIFFYFLFSIAMRISHKYRGLYCGLFLLAFVAAARLLPSPPAFLAFYGNPVMLEFLLGMICYGAARGLYRLYRSRKLSRFCLCFTIPLLAVGFPVLALTKQTVNILGFRRLLVWGIPTFLIVLCAFLTGLFFSGADADISPSCPERSAPQSSREDSSSPTRRAGRVQLLPLISSRAPAQSSRGTLFSTPRPAGCMLRQQPFSLCTRVHTKKPGLLVWLGNISFSLYLVHYYPVMLLDRAVFDFSACTPRALLGAAVAVAVSIFCAFISWALIEKRFSAWLRSLLLR